MQTKDQIKKDIINSWDSLLIDGIMWMDDYLGDYDKLKKAFDEAIPS